MELQGIQKVKQARARLVLSQPFFGSMAIGLRIEVDNTCPTAYTNGRKIGFNESFINGLKLNEVEALLCHEVLHVVMLHPLRIMGRQHQIANMAMDYVVNGQLQRAGMSVGTGWLLDAKWSGPDWSFETVYSDLMKQAQPVPKPGNGNGQGNSNQDKQSGGGNGSGEKQDDQDANGEKGQGVEDDRQEGSGSDGSSDTGGDSGGDSSGGRTDGNDSGEQGDSDDGKPVEAWQLGEVREAKAEDGGPMSESERSQYQQDIKTAMNKALQHAKSCGKVPGGMERLVERMTVQKRDIEEILRDFVQRTIGGDYTWTRPNKKHLIHDLYLPSMQCDAIPDIIMVMDTSGSIGQNELAYFQAKLESVLSEYETTVHVCYCDTQAHDGGEYRREDLPMNLKPMGGGGTDFRPPFKWLESKDIEPAAMIYLTDLECSSFPDEPDFPVLWAVYNAYRGGRGWKVPFGEVVDINPE